jgi:hypothetical protein
LNPNPSAPVVSLLGGMTPPSTPSVSTAPSTTPCPVTTQSGVPTIEGRPTTFGAPLTGRMLGMVTGACR